MTGGKWIGNALEDVGEPSGQNRRVDTIGDPHRVGQVVSGTLLPSRQMSRLAGPLCPPHYVSVVAVYRTVSTICSGMNLPAGQVHPRYRKLGMARRQMYSAPL